MLDLLKPIGAAVLFGWSAFATRLMLHGDPVKGAIMLAVPELIGIGGAIAAYYGLKLNKPGSFSGIMLIYPAIVQGIYCSGSVAYLALYGLKYLLNNI